MINIAIVDDQELMRDGLRRILSTYEELQVVATGKNGFEALEICKQHQLDVLLLDIRMPEMNGVETVKKLKEEKYRVKVVMLTTFEDEEYIVQAMAYGASGYLFKDMPYDQLAECVKEVHEGRFMMPQKVAEVLAKNIYAPEALKKRENPYDFTERDVQIAEMMKDGFTNKQIAKTLYISEGTVKNYVSNIYAKTQTENRVEAANLLKSIF